MKEAPLLLVSYRRGTEWRAGIASGTLLIDAADLEPFGHEYPPTVRGLLESGPERMGMVLHAAETAFNNRDTRLTRLAEAAIGPPVPDPDKIICLGLNYREHAAEILMDVAAVPTFFAKFRNALCGPYDPIVLPAVSRQVDYEGELAVVIGRRCRKVSEHEALDFIAGYTIMNDVSARDLQMQTSQWSAGKTPDTFAPMGPGLAPSSSIPDPQNLTITTRVNGVVLQEGHTSEMIFPVAATIAFLSSFMTLEPGDIISTGTPAGVGFKRRPPVFLKAGDLVEVEIGKIGVIRNPVIGETPGGLPPADRSPGSALH